MGGGTASAGAPVSDGLEQAAWTSRLNSTPYAAYVGACCPTARGHRALRVRVRTNNYSKISIALGPWEGTFTISI